MSDLKLNLRSFEWNDWKFLFPDITVIETIGDGSCLIHAIAAACLWIYRRMIGSNGRPIDRHRYVQSIRSDLAKRLGEVIVVDTNREEYQRVTHYDLLGNGNIKELGKTNRKYSLPALQELLQSSQDIDYSLFEFISDFFDKDLYFLSNETKDVLILEYSNDRILHKRRDSIVIMAYENPAHFDLVGLNPERDPERSSSDEKASMGEASGLKTFFSCNHPFIQAIRNRMKQQHAEAKREHEETKRNHRRTNTRS